MDAEIQNRVDWKRVLLYCGIAFGLSYTIALVIVFTGGLVDSPMLAPGISLALVLMVAYMLTPAIAHVMTRAFTREGWHALYLRPRLKQGWGFWLLAWFGTPLLVGVGMLAYFVLFPQYYDPELGILQEMLASSGMGAGDLPVPVAVLLALQTLQAVLISPLLNAIPVMGEEFGWRAYLQPRLMPLGPRKAMVLTGVVWGLWHAPIIAMGYNYGNFDMHYWGAPWSGIVMMTLATVWLGIFFGWLVERAGSVWPAVIGHGSLNGIAGVALFMVAGTPLLLLGPSAVGLVGGSGFILAAAVILLLPRSFRHDTIPLQMSEIAEEAPVLE